MTSVIMWSVCYIFFSWCLQILLWFFKVRLTSTDVQTQSSGQSCLHEYPHWQWVWTSQVVCSLTVSANSCVCQAVCLFMLFNLSVTFCLAQDVDVTLKCFSWWLLVCSKSVTQDVSVQQNTVMNLEQQQRWSNLHFNFLTFKKLAFRAVRTYVAKERLNCCKRQKIEKLQGLRLVGNQYFLRVYTLFVCRSLGIFTHIYVSVARLQLPSVCYVPAGPKSKVCCPLGDASCAWLRLCFLAL